MVLPEKASQISHGALLSDAKLEFGKCLHERAALSDPEAVYKTLEHMGRANQCIGEARKLAASSLPSDVEDGIAKASQEVFDAVAVHGFLSRLQQVVTNELSELPAVKEQEKILKSGASPNIRSMFLKAGVVKNVAALEKFIAVFGQFKEVDFAHGSYKRRLFLSKCMEAKTGVDKAKTLAFLGFGVATLCDLNKAQKWHESDALALLLMAAIEQVTLDEGRWALGWLYTHLPQPPWSRISHKPAHDPLRPHPKMLPESWAAAAAGYVKEMSTLTELRKKNSKGAGKDEKVEQ